MDRDDTASARTPLPGMEEKHMSVVSHKHDMKQDNDLPELGRVAELS